MAGTDADSGDARPSADEWRVDRGDSRGSEAESPPAAASWSQADVRLRCARVSADLVSWREVLDDRVRHLEERLSRAGDSQD
jgi:hypothetical protein